MAFSFEPVVASDLTLDRDNLTIVRKFRMRGTLPYNGSNDAFDFVSNAVMNYVITSYPTYSTPMGVLYWNSIQLHENYYALSYDISVTYSPREKQSGTYQISVDQAVGSVHVTAGRRIAWFGDSDKELDSEGLFWNGQEVTGTDIPVAEDRITISYRHPRAFLNRSYIRAIGRLRGYPNADPFLGYAAGEVRYMGGNFTESDSESSASYTFDISPNVTNLVVAGITITSKSGFDVLSPVYETDVDTNPAGKKHGIKKVKCIQIIRPREHVNYGPVFGWGW